MKVKLLIIISLTLFCCKPKEDHKIVSDVFKWEIIIPSDFRVIENAEWEKTKEEGKQYVVNDTETEINDYSTQIFVFDNGEFNRIDANYTSKSSFIKPNSTFKETFEIISEILHTSFVNTAPNAEIETNMTTEIIDGLEFLKYEMSTKVDEYYNIKSINYKRLFEDYVLSININYIDEDIGTDMLNSLRSSKFSKN